MSEHSKLEYTIMALILVPSIWILNSMAMHQKLQYIDINKNRIYDMDDSISFSDSSTYKIRDLGPKYQLWIYHKLYQKASKK